ncbi:DUF3558 family protein [Catellatospora citrea]|uniref:DUF3558 domain-containing protein n=1 Tax=Catellatospora citrea TaxID=53366 RepID=A0A8J3NYC1_9ACTN|nr:DUF3558 family protein [Catellatospora citrea]RKE05548.1 uncharacterized protein DUF3558 [Catellatospora citrea]GIF96898.1 hypothetical protein Cci01nite_19920 [Catellatospora citrea]
MRTHSRLLPAALLAVLFALSACGDGGTPAAQQPAPPGQDAPADAPPESAAPSAPAAIDPCTVITAAEAAKLAGTKLDEPVSSAPVSCRWTAPVTGPTAQVEVYVGDGAQKVLDIERTLGHEIVQLSGIGDEAWLDTTACEVFWLQSGQWIAIRLVRLNDAADNLKPLEDLARAAAGRL